jgi:hypothetical protein
MNKNPFSSLKRRTVRMKKPINANRLGEEELNSKNSENINANRNRHIAMARKVGYNSSVAEAGLARSKYIEYCEAQGIKPDPKVVEQYQKGINNAINRLRERKFGKTRKSNKRS